MYLVHLRLLPHPDGVSLPQLTAALMLAGGTTDVNRVEHVALHPTAQPWPVIGVYINANTPSAAKMAAVRSWRRAVLTHPPLAQWVLLSADVPRLGPDLEF